MAKVNGQKLRRPERGLQRLNQLFVDLTDTMASTSTKRRRELDALASEVDDIIYGDMQDLSKTTGDNMSTYLSKLFRDEAREESRSAKSIEEIFSEDGEGGGMFNFFRERYKNQNLMYEDLNAVCAQLNELEEAINTTRDSIVTADDMSVSVSHSLTFDTFGGGEEDRRGYIDTVENMQRKFRLLQRLRNHIIPNALKYGKYYVYTIPYSELFKQHQARQEKGAKMGSVMESVSEAEITDFCAPYKSVEGFPGTNAAKQTFKSITENIEICEESYGIPLIENTELAELFDTDMFKKKMGSVGKSAGFGSEATVDTEKKGKHEDFSNVSDCYIKLIDPRKIIPVKILDQVIGYYYIHEETSNTTKSPFSHSFKTTAAINQKEMEGNFLNTITTKIVKSFNKKYLEQNAEFKELILNALIYHDVYSKSLKFQFIPVDYITAFHVNRDEEGEGQSVIMPALFYAKLFLSLLIFKMISILTKSNDTRIYYVRNSGVDKNISNKTQEIARSVKEKQINFTDLLNMASMTSKVGQAREIFMPVGKSGEKGIDFDILAGQDVQLNTELMEMLRTSYINGTGVPSVIMNFLNEADYSRSLVMGNNKFLSRVVNFQLDFNECATEMYRKILRFSSSMDPDVIESFNFKLATPKSLTVTNLSDTISNAQNVIDIMLKAISGEQGEMSNLDNITKDIAFRKFARENLPMLPWTRIEELYEEAKIEALKVDADKKAQGGDPE